MIIIFLFLFSLYFSLSNKSIQYFYIYHILSISGLFIFAFNNVDVAYKINQSLPSDTFLYYTAYIEDWDKILTHTFGIYSYVLRIIEYPFHNSLFAVWGQVVITFLLLDIIITNKKNLLFIISFHAIIFLNTNMFKDNLILIIGLLSYILLDKYKNTTIQMIIIFITISSMSIIRPFLGMAMPLTFIPFWFKIKSERKKTVLLIVGLILAFILLLSKKTYIEGVINTFANDTAVLEGKSNFLVAIFKIFLGPTPMHYFYAKEFFVQPFLNTQGYFYALLHISYYISFSFWIAYIYVNRRLIFISLKTSLSKCFILLLAISQLFCYTIVYGSADVRQRAIIISFIFISSITLNTSIIKSKLQNKEFRIFIIVFMALILLTIVST